MKKNSFTKIFLFLLTMALMFVFAVQQRVGIWTFKPLNGVFVPTPEPELTLETYRTAQYQSQSEAFLKENFGFREPLIRFYNQFLFDCFKKSYNSDIVIGKDNWLYFIQHVNDYYGTEMYRWYDSKEEACQAYDREAQLMWKLRGVLQDYGIDFMVFMAPQKGFLYPEHLPDRKKDTTSVNAREYFSAKFDAYGFPYVEMTKWFKELKQADTLPYSLFPQTGAHWCFSAALASDSLFRFMGDLKGIKLPRLEYGPFFESFSKETLEPDYDIEMLANLIRPIPHKYDKLYEAEVTAVSDETTTRPTALFVGTSFLMRMYYFVPFDDVFSNSEYWYYNSTVYYGKKYRSMTQVSELDILQKLLDADYVVWFTEGDQMCKASFGFVESALTHLCVSDERIEEVKLRVLDSLRSDGATMLKFKDFKGDELTAKLWDKTNELMMKVPEKLFPELAGDSVPTTRNPRIPEALVIRDIKQDTAWMKNLQCQTVIRNASLKQVLEMEAQNVLNDRPLMRDEQNVVSRQTYVESLVKAMEEQILHNPELLESIREKAVANGLSFEEQLHADAAWIVNYQIEQGEIEL